MASVLKVYPHHLIYPTSLVSLSLCKGLCGELVVSLYHCVGWIHSLNDHKLFWFRTWSYSLLFSRQWFSLVSQCFGCRYCFVSQTKPA